MKSDIGPLRAPLACVGDTNEGGSMRFSPTLVSRAARVATLGYACLALAPLPARAVDATPAANGETGPMKAVMAEYRKKLAEYNMAWEAYEKIAGPYWRDVTEKRSRRRTKMANDIKLTTADYVMTQPPPYRGPQKPDNPLAPKAKGDVPDVTDFLANAKSEFDFVPEGPADEGSYTRA
jgi:hypothetical protein